MNDSKELSIFEASTSMGSVTSIQNSTDLFGLEDLELNYSEQSNSILQEADKLLEVLLKEVESDPSTIIPSLDEFLEDTKRIVSQLENLSSNEMIPTFNWTRLSDEFDIIYTEYTDGMKQTIEEFEKIDFTRLVWQDSAHKVDGDRATKRINAIEEWTINTEGYLEQLRQELASSLSVIQSTLSKLDDGKVYSHIEPENSEIPPNGPN